MDTGELIRAAQELEVAGDRNGAAGRLEAAARIYLKEGASHRAAALYRHALKLAPDRAELASALRIAESWGASGGDLSQSVSALPGEPYPALRGPTRADPDVEAWCSFCCRPDKEAGSLVAGPSGAYICGTCLATAAREILRAPKSSGPAGSTTPSGGDADAVEARLFGRIVGQDTALRRLMDALRLFWAAPAGAPVRTLALVGSSGSGKTAVLETLAESGPVRTLLFDAGVVGRRAASEALIGGSPLLVLLDNAQAWRESGGLGPLRDACRRGSAMAVAAVTAAEPPAVETVLRSASADVVSAPVYGGAVADGADAVVVLAPPSEDAIAAMLDAPTTYFPELGAIAPKWIVTQPVRTALVAMAQRSGSVESLRRALLAAGVAAAAGQRRDEVIVDGVQGGGRKRRGRRG